ncbi:MAG: preprotein translocase subunit SecG [Archangiaceae bacterium]|nr:preprotein translocase subunit SecG [Archangiaceae bacterium]
MIYFVSAVHVLLCVFMIFVILLQPGKDAGMGAALGGGAATSAFGGRGAVTFLGKVTAVCAIAYFITSLGLSFVGLRGSVANSIVDETSTSAPAKPVGEGAKPEDAPPPPSQPLPTEGKAVDAPPSQGAVEMPSDKPGQPVPSTPDKKVNGTEAGP